MPLHSDKIKIQHQALHVSETTEQNRRPTEIDLLEVIFDLDTDGTPGRNFGPAITTSYLEILSRFVRSIRFTAKDSTTREQNIGRISFRWDVAAHASRKSYMAIEVVDARFYQSLTFVEVMRVYADGTVMILVDEEWKEL